MASGTEVGKIYYTLELDDSKLKSGMKSSEDSVSSFGSNLTKLGAAIGGVFVAAKIKDFAMESVKAFQESEAAIAQTNAVLQSTGGQAGVTADAVTELATALQKQTTYSDEAVRSAENMLLTFTNIGKDVFPDATKTVLNMSTALGQDTKSSAIQLGKALNNPIDGITALTRVGVKFTDQQKDQITKLVESGKTMEAQKIILGELNTEFGGSAAAAADTYAGRMEQLKNQFNDVQENIGGLILKALEPLMGILMAVVGWIEKNQGAIATWLPYIAIIVGSILAVVGAIKLWGLAQLALNAIMATNPIVFLFMAIIAVILLVVTHWDTLKGYIQAFWENVQQWFENGVNFIKEHWDLLVVILTGGIGLIAVVFIKNFDSIKNFFVSVWHVIVDLWQGIPGFFSGLWQGIKNGAGAVVDIITSPFKTAFNAISRLWNNTAGKLSFKAPDWVPGIGGKGFSMPQLPYLAKGGPLKAGQAGIIGEAGPELFVPKTSGEVIPNSQIANALNGGAGMQHTTNIYGDINLANDVDVDNFFAKINRNQKLEEMGLTGL